MMRRCPSWFMILETYHDVLVGSTWPPPVLKTIGTIENSRVLVTHVRRELIEIKPKRTGILGSRRTKSAIGRWFCDRL